MLVIDDIKTALWTWVNGQCAPSVAIWLRPDAPPPLPPYVTLNLNTLLPVAEDFVGSPDENGLAAITGNREFTLEIQTFGLDAMGVMEKIRSSLHYPSVQAELQSAGIAFVETMPIQNISILDMPRFEDRAAMDVRFRVASIGEDDVGLIETITGTETYRDVDGEVILTAPITISIQS